MTIVINATDYSYCCFLSYSIRSERCPASRIFIIRVMLRSEELRERDRYCWKVYRNFSCCLSEEFWKGGEITHHRITLVGLKNQRKTLSLQARLDSIKL